jgi:ribosome-binding protein aMBF1 (putative translation factor)
MKTERERLDNLFDDISPSIHKWVGSTMRISVEIDEAMKRKNLSVEQTAKLFKVSSETIRNWRGGCYNFTLKQLCNIEEKLEITLFLVKLKS